MFTNCPISWFTVLLLIAVYYTNGGIIPKKKVTVSKIVSSKGGIPGLENIINNPNIDPGFSQGTSRNADSGIPGLENIMNNPNIDPGFSLVSGRNANSGIPGLENIINNPNVDPGFSRPGLGKPNKVNKPCPPQLKIWPPSFGWNLGYYYPCAEINAAGGQKPQPQPDVSNLPQNDMAGMVPESPQDDDSFLPQGEQGEVPQDFDSPMPEMVEGEDETPVLPGFQVLPPESFNEGEGTFIPGKKPIRDDWLVDTDTNVLPNDLPPLRFTPWELHANKPASHKEVEGTVNTEAANNWLHLAKAQAHL